VVEVVKSNRFYGNHYMAQCHECEFECLIGEGLTRKKVQYKSKKHVKETGHYVVLEFTTAIHYSRK